MKVLSAFVSQTHNITLHLTSLTVHFRGATTSEGSSLASGDHRKYKILNYWYQYNWWTENTCFWNGML